MEALTPFGDPSGRAAADVWIAVDEPAAVATVRRRAAAAAGAAGLGHDRVREVEIVASELATNVVKHGRGGDMVVRMLPGGGIQLIAIDAGPGTRDLESLIDDGRSTAGTLGLGLGAVRRLASSLRLWSEPARGAIVVADVVDGGTGVDDAPAGQRTDAAVGHLVRTLRGEHVCGDAVAWRRSHDGWMVMVADGLGHGPLAAEPSRRAAELLRSAPSESPRELVQQMHTALAGTRGAAVAVSRVDLAARVLTHAAVGNISGRLVGGSTRTRALVSQPGIVGHRLPRVQENRYGLEGTDVVVLHSDGLTDKWDGSALPSVLRHGPVVCAAALLRDAGTRRDDASVLALQVAS